MMYSFGVSFRDVFMLSVLWLVIWSSASFVMRSSAPALISIQDSFRSDLRDDGVFLHICHYAVCSVMSVRCTVCSPCCH